MITQDEMKDFLNQVVSETMPDELLAFEVEGDNLLTDLYQGKGVEADPAARAEYEFMDATGAQTILEFVKLLTATFGLFKSMSEAFPIKVQDQPEEAMAKQWRDQLVRAGLSEKKADEIVRRFSTDLVKRIQRL